MKNQDFEILKTSGKKARFSLDKLRKSLKYSGASNDEINSVIDVVRDELYHGISTKEIYAHAFTLLKNKKPIYASRYKLKKAIYELGPTGFPFGRFVAAVLQHSGYQVQVGQIINGKCVAHEVDIVAKDDNQYLVIECKFHGEEGPNCNVKIPLYIHSRYQDILNFTKLQKKKVDIPSKGWVVTNTRFTKDAIQYGNCVGLYLLSWDYPLGNGLKDRIDRIGLYPITVSTMLTNVEKQFLLSRNIVLCKELIGDVFYLDQLEISDERKLKIINEIKLLCNT